jgi:phosphoribosylanthranilate isomerase
MPDAGSARVQIKICGLTRLEDARLAFALGAEYLGFIFAPSRRRVDARSAGALLRALQQEGVDGGPTVQRVGVFVNTGRRLIEETASQAGLTMLQLHGDEEPEFCDQFDLPVIKALRFKDRGVFDRVAAYRTPYILLEPYLPGSYGGTGVQADWALAAELVRTFPDKRFFLAGGLGPENVQAAVSAVRPFAVDASSALESGPGLKDREKLKAFIEAAKNQRTMRNQSKRNQP